MSNSIIYPQDSYFAASIPQREGFSSEAARALGAEYDRIISKNTKKKGLEVNMMSEDHNSHWEYTQFPIEDKTPITDHMIKKQPSFSFVFLVSQDPCLLLGGGLVENAATVATNLYNGKTDPFKMQHYPSEIWKWLNKMADAAGKIDILTILDYYEDMTITDLAAPVASKNYVEFTITCKKVRYAYTDTVGAYVTPSETSPIKKKTAMQKLDQQPPKDPAPEAVKNEVDKSLMYETGQKAADAIVNFFGGS